jgi:protein SCO1/2
MVIAVCLAFDSQLNISQQGDLVVMTIQKDKKQILAIALTVLSTVALLALVISMTFIGVAAHAEDEHAHHHHMMQPDMKAEIKRSVVDIAVPATKLVRQDSTAVTLSGELADKKPVVLAFMYTSCTTVCPVTSQILAKAQELLGKDLEGVRLVSISIDPEYDSAARLTEYSKKFDAKPQWQHYTGTVANSVAVQKVFNAYRGDKMNHLPLFFVNGGGKKAWVRLEGFPAAEQVVKELREQAKS